MPVDASVVIAAYNVEPFIAGAIDSALAQKDVAVEVIVVDDASTDRTAEIVSAIADVRVKFLKLDRNGGPSVARNAGFAIAEGKWIAVLDGDDLYYPERLKRCLDRAAASGADIVVDNPVTMSVQDGSMAPMYGEAAFRALEPLDLARFITGNRLFAPGYSLGYLKPVFRADFLRAHNLAYDPGLRIGEDYLLFAEALTRGAKCAVEPSAGYVYTVRAGSISHRLNVADIDRMDASDEQFLARHTLDAAALSAQRLRTRSLREARAYTMLIDALKRKRPAEGLAAIRYCPSAVRYLWWPVLARLERLRKKISQG
jgi:succinoglycan biosynthesis protein ExoO